MTTIKIVNVETGVEIEREMDAAELLEYGKGLDAEKLYQDAIAAKATKKAALLSRMGLTEDEARLLLS
jgi:hypothetical protein